MTRKTLETAIDLQRDIENISEWVEEHEKDRHWITISTLHHNEAGISDMMQKELCEWLKQKKAEYEKELEAL